MASTRAQTDILNGMRFITGNSENFTKTGTLPF
jgi:hypothetical protein